ncbi:hypothetical protein EV360DRAFT_73898 [Lentinula raphanica]|nr:hypothetical protein EV360DRAFT_73898 [Lentinula raphanica]
MFASLCGLSGVLVRVRLSVKHNTSLRPLCFKNISTHLRNCQIWLPLTRYRRAPKRRGQEERKINHKLLLLSYLWLTWFDSPAGNRSSYMLCLVLIHKNLILHSTPHDDSFTTTSLSPLALRLTPLLSKVSLMKIGLHGLLPYAVKNVSMPPALDVNYSGLAVISPQSLEQAAAASTRENECQNNQ